MTLSTTIWTQLAENYTNTVFHMNADKHKICGPQRLGIGSRKGLLELKCQYLRYHLKSWWSKLRTIVDNSTVTSKKDGDGEVRTVPTHYEFQIPLEQARYWWALVSNRNIEISVICPEKIEIVSTMFLTDWQGLRLASPELSLLPPFD